MPMHLSYPLSPPGPSIPSSRAKSASDAGPSSTPPASSGGGAFASPASGAATVKGKKKARPLPLPLSTATACSHVALQAATPAKAKPAPAARAAVGGAAAKVAKDAKIPAAAGEGAAKKAPAKEAAQVGDATALALFRQEVLDLGGGDIAVLGWGLGAPKDDDKKDSGGHAKGGKPAGHKFVSPAGKAMTKAEALKALGLGGQTREQCFKKAQEYRLRNPLPLTCGNVAVLRLGNIMVERGPGEPLFHKADCFFPIEFKSVWTDTNTGVEYTSEILDGMDVFEKDSMAYQVSWGSNKVVKEVVEDAWQAVKALQIETGTDVEKTVAKAWPSKNLALRSGLWEREVRMRLEGMRGAIDCFRYRFLGERGGPSPAGAPAAPKAKTGKAVVPRKVPAGGSADSKEAKLKKSGGKKAADKAADAVAKKQPQMATPDGKPRAKRPQGKSAFQMFSKEHRKRIADDNPDMSVGELTKLMNGLYKDLPQEERERFEALATRVAPAAEGDAEGKEDDADDDGIKEEDDLTKWLTDGNEHLGKQVRRYVYDYRGTKVDCKHGVVTHWLPAEVADYISEETGQPASLWKVTFDDERVGSEDLEEHEVIEANSLLGENLSDRIKDRMARSEASLEAYRVKLKEREEARLAKLAQKEEERLKRQKDKEEREAERIKHKAEIQQLKADAKEMAGVEKAPAIDESLMPCTGGPNKGKISGVVPKPAGSDASFPPASSVQDFLPVFMFLRDLSNPLGAVRMSFDEIKNCLVSTSKDGTEGFSEVAKWLTDIAVRSKWIKTEEPEEKEEKEIVDKDAMLDVMEFALAPGPLLNGKSKEVASTKDVIAYSCWQLTNESSWPELARQMMVSSAIGGEYKALSERLGEVEVSELTSEERMMLLRCPHSSRVPSSLARAPISHATAHRHLRPWTRVPLYPWCAVAFRRALTLGLRFLCDEACSSDKVQRVINAKLKQVERILERKRMEDAAIRKREHSKKQLAKQVVTLDIPQLPSTPSETHALECGGTVVTLDVPNTQSAPCGRALGGGEVLTDE